LSITSVTPDTLEEGSGPIVVAGTGFLDATYTLDYITDIATSDTEIVIDTSGLLAADLTLSIEKGGDIVTHPVTITAPAGPPADPLTASLTKGDEGDFATTISSGPPPTITVNVSGGVPPYTYAWTGQGLAWGTDPRPLVVSQSEVDFGETAGCLQGNFTQEYNNDAIWMFLGSDQGGGACSASGSGGTGTVSLRVTDSDGTQVLTNTLNFDFIGW